MNIFKKWKELKEEWIRWSNIDDVLNLTYDYKRIEIKEPIIIDDIYIVKHDDGLIFFVKKDNWKKYIGVNRDWLEDSMGNDFSHDHLFKTSDLKNITSCYKSDIPKEMIEEMENELMKNKDDLKNILECAKKEEFYESNCMDK
jgi:hypothetical protein